MNKNRKGFTLVELLAVIVILGILMIFSVPIITNMLDRSRNKIYVDDAKKLISQAEYQMKKSSNDIEIPDPGDCIIISLVYLDSSSFDNPPNDGEYEKESSFVVVKNDGGKLKYSATIVEKYRGNSYKGVELTTNEVLNSSQALKHVKSFKSSDLRKVDENVDVAYIKDKLGNDYLSGSITAVYNYPSSNSGNAITGDSFVPKFLKATIDSVTNYNSLETTLTINVKDEDTPKNKLTIYIAYDGYIENTPIPYGNNEQFTYNINFADLGYSYDTGGEATVYIIVKDPDGNYARKKLTYQIQKNKAPEINDEKSYITKRGSDSVNKTTALLTFSVSDDISTLDKLKVCLNESTTPDMPTTCNEYKNYNEVFSQSNTLEYTFKNCAGGTCSRDGSTHYLNVFVQDEKGLTTSKQFVYTFSTNTAPNIKSVEVVSDSEVFTDSGSKNVHVSVDAEDDLDSGDKLSVTITDGVQTKNYTYSNNAANNSFKFNFNGTYDGSGRVVTVTVKDSEGASSSKKSSTYTLYTNKAPVINKFNVSSSANVCTNVNVCGDVEGGNKDIKIEVGATDDIDYANNYSALKVCVSENESDCNSDSNYRPYSDYYENTIDKTLSGNYDGSTKTIYLKVKDSYGSIDSKSIQYKLYSNLKPVITDFDVESLDDGKVDYGSTKTKITLNAEDDFDKENDIRVTISGGGVTLNDTLKNLKEVEYDILGSYDGSTKTITVTVQDSLGLTDTKTVDYQLYKNANPTIDEVSIVSDGSPCPNTTLCNSDFENGGSYDVKYELKASDELDKESDLKICVSEDQTYCDSESNYRPYSDFYNSTPTNPKKISYTFANKPATNPYTGAVKKLYFYVMDSMGGKDFSEMEYTLYKNKAPEIVVEPEIESKSIYDGINIPNVKYSVLAIDDFNENLEIKYCKKVDGEESCTNYQSYNDTIDLGNDFFNTNRNTGKTYEIYSYVKDSYGEEVKSKSINYTLYEDQAPIIYKNELKGVYIDTYYKDGNVVDYSEIEALMVYYDEDDNPMDKDNNPLTEQEEQERLDALAKYNVERQIAISFKVRDYYDTYQICVSEDENSCTNYVDTNYDGNSDDLNVYSFQYTGVGLSDNAFYVYLKDSYGHIAKFVSDSEGTITTERSSVLPISYVECENVDTASAKYEYIFNATKQYKDEQGNPVNNNQKISIDRCGGKCYYTNYADNTINDIVAYYDKVITFKDRYNSSKTCGKKNGQNLYQSDYKATCSFKDCFYKNNNYERRVIGTEHFDDDVEWTTTISGKGTYVCDGYYKLYLSSYNEGDESISLTEITNEKICDTAVEQGAYDYDSSSNDPYVRISESRN